MHPNDTGNVRDVRTPMTDRLDNDQQRQVRTYLIKQQQQQLLQQKQNKLRSQLPSLNNTPRGGKRSARGSGKD